MCICVCVCVRERERGAKTESVVIRIPVYREPMHLRCITSDWCMAREGRAAKRMPVEGDRNVADHFHDALTNVL